MQILSRKFSALFFGSTLLLTSLAAVSVAPQAWAEEKHTELEEKMEDMSAAFKKVRRQVGDPAQNPATLALVGKVIEGSNASLKLVPAKLLELPEAERAKAVAEYKKQMEKLISVLQELEAALKANNNAAAEVLVKEIGAMQKSGHKEFKRADS